MPAANGIGFRDIREKLPSFRRTLGIEPKTASKNAPRTPGMHQEMGPVAGICQFSGPNFLGLNCSQISQRSCP